MKGRQPAALFIMPKGAEAVRMIEAQRITDDQAERLTLGQNERKLLNHLRQTRRSKDIDSVRAALGMSKMQYAKAWRSLRAKISRL